jgi:16S rRNA (cytosine1402-N4)-methyltransferase
MSYHSLEDRMVKNYINKGKVFGEVEKDFFGNEIKPFEAVNRKPIEASEEEIAENSRARSAKLRIGVRL